jgi:hypothetical protein
VRSPTGGYAAWVEWLDAFGRGVDLPPDHLAPITDELGPHQQERLFRHVSEAFTNRQKRWSDAMRRDQALLLITPERASATLAVMQVNARTMLAPLRHLTENTRLPEALRTSLRTALETTVRSAQRSLEDAVRQTPAELQAAVRTNSLLGALTRPQPSQPPAGRPTGRRVIL